MTEIFPRHVAEDILASLEDTPVVVVNGARQVGKSTLVGALPYRGTTRSVTMESPSDRAAARRDPLAFLDSRVDTMVIDEVQLEPDLFRAIKLEVDRDRRPGRFVLTGSSRLLSAPDMADSLVGRVEIHDLWPLSQDELEASRSSFVDRIPGGAPELPDSTLTRGDLAARICAGGFPEAVRRDRRRRSGWFSSYVTTTVQRVIRQLSDIDRAARIPQVLELCAARSGQEVNVSNLSSDLGIPARTLDGYLSLLSSAFLVHLIPSWSTRISSKAVRRPKMILLDSGLAASLRGADEDSLRDGHDAALGPLLETFVAAEILKLASWSAARPRVSHFRDRGGAEVDLVLEYPGRGVVGLEVKATATVRDEHFRGLRLLADRLGERFLFGAVLSLTPHVSPWGPRMAALPVDSLWRTPPLRDH
jgi:hypothetical protein